MVVQKITSFLPSQKQKSVKTLATEVRIALDCIKTLTYNCGEEHYETLQQVNDDLKGITATLRKQLPESEGLVVRPQLKLKDLVRQKRNVALKLRISQVPPKRHAGRKRANSAYRNRHGKKAASLRKVQGDTYGIVSHIDLIPI